ncbi:hypothetical protein ACGF1Z_34465 [Streptomyces sp. NPDC048018]|uniref:hypothetical protein n=1 Tax=Streptomyces sp. NPDC048018 TaxID=3365499 RepID=UPI00371CB949
MDDIEPAFDSSVVFPGKQPWDVVFDALWVTHGEFWLVAGSGPGADITSAVPEGDGVQGNGEAVGIPASASGRVGVALSVWAGPAPDGQGVTLGASLISVPDRELALVNVEGREPGPVLVLPDDGDYEVRAWRCPPTEEQTLVERYDIRAWLCPTQRD